MKTINDCQVNEKAQTISAIVGIEINAEGWEFLRKPCCHLILKKTEDIYFIKYEADDSDINSLRNGYYRVILDGDRVWEAERITTTYVVEDFKF